LTETRGAHPLKATVHLGRRRYAYLLQSHNTLGLFAQKFSVFLGQLLRPAKHDFLSVLVNRYGTLTAHILNPRRRERMTDGSRRTVSGHAAHRKRTWSLARIGVAIRRNP
jgi:hypothetical protein